MHLHVNGIIAKIFQFMIADFNRSVIDFDIIMLYNYCVSTNCFFRKRG